MDTGSGLQAINLSCVRQHKKLFTDISFALNPGDALLIEGENGSGKSSLLRLLTGLSTPFSGDIYWQSKAISSIPTEYREEIHYLGHLNGIKLGLTVNENLQLASHLSNTVLSHPKEILTLLKLNRHEQIQTKYLSAGQKRRVALAKLFLFPKKIWLLDEPLTALDTQTQTIFLDQLNKHLQNGGISIISSHHPMTTSASMQTLRLASC